MEKKITLLVNEDGSIQIDYPNDISFMEIIGIIDASKTILLNRYVHSKKD